MGSQTASHDERPRGARALPLRTARRDGLRRRRVRSRRLVRSGGRAADGIGGADRDVGRGVRGRFAVRRDVGARRGRQRGDGDRDWGNAERALPPDGRGSGGGAAREQAASWALAARGEGGFDRETLLGGTLPQYPGWVLGTIVGVVAGGALGDPESLGLDAIFPAFFLGLLAAELRRPHAVATVLIGGGIALALTPVLPAGLPVLLASLAALVGLRR